MVNNIKLLLLIISNPQNIWQFFTKSLFFLVKVRWSKTTQKLRHFHYLTNGSELRPLDIWKVGVPFSQLHLTSATNQKMRDCNMKISQVGFTAKDLSTVDVFFLLRYKISSRCSMPRKIGRARKKQIITENKVAI